MNTRNKRKVNLPKSLNRKLEELSNREGITADQFIATAVAEKMSALLIRIIHKEIWLWARRK
jgi:hypothetical protein